MAVRKVTSLTEDEFRDKISTLKANPAVKGYQQIQEALRYVIAMADDFGLDNVVEGHYRLIHTHNKSVTLTPGSISRELGGHQSVINEWNVNVRLLMVQDKDRLETFYHDAIKAREHILDTIDKYPVLGGIPGVILCWAGGADEPEWTQIQRLYVWTQVFEVQVRQQVSNPARR